MLDCACRRRYRAVDSPAIPPPRMTTRSGDGDEEEAAPRSCSLPLRHRRHICNWPLEAAAMAATRLGISPRSIVVRRSGEGKGESEFDDTKKSLQTLAAKLLKGQP